MDTRVGGKKRQLETVNQLPKLGGGEVGGSAHWGHPPARKTGRRSPGVFILVRAGRGHPAHFPNTPQGAGRAAGTPDEGSRAW